MAPPSPSSISPARRSRLAIATTSPRQASRAAGRLAPQRRRGDRDAELQPDEVIGPPQRGVAPGGVGRDAVFGEAAADVVGLALEHGVDAPAQVVRDLAAVALARRRSPRPCPCAAGCRPRRAGAGGRAGPTCRRAGRPARPRAARRPVALAIAAISMPDLVPSRKELNICGFMPPSRRLLRASARNGPRPSPACWRGRRGRYFVPLPAATTVKPPARSVSTISQTSAGWSP